MRAKVGTQTIHAILEPRSNTMKMGVHKDTLLNSLAAADVTYLFEPKQLDWSLHQAADKANALCFDAVDDIVSALIDRVLPGDHVLVMSNGGFDGIHQKIITALTNKYSQS